MKKISILLFAIIFAVPLFTNAQGCMEPASDQGVNLIGFIQPQWEMFSDGVDKYGNSIENYNSFNMFRARIGATGNIPYDINYYVMAEYSSFIDGVYLLDAFVTYTRLGPWAKFSLGQFKTPMSLELATPCHALPTVYRSLVVRQLVSPFRDLGLQVSGSVSIKKYGSLENHKFFSYQLGIMNGTGINQWDDNSSKDIVFRGIIYPWTGVHIGGSGRYGKQTPYSKAAGDGVRTTIGAEIKLEYFNFMLQGEYLYGYGKNLAGKAGAGCGGGGTPAIVGELERSGYYAMLLYKTPWNLEPVVKYEVYNPADKYDYELDPTYPTESVSTITLGLNYFVNDWSRIQLNYMIHDDSNEVHSLITDRNDAYFKQQFVIQFQAILQ